MIKIGVIGNGNWGTTIAKLVAENISQQQEFDKEVKLWVFEEMYEGQKLSEIINRDHENPKYLPGIKLPLAIRATTDYDLADLNVVLFALPCQFIGTYTKFRLGKHVLGISFSKGILERNEEICTPSKYIEKLLGIRCSSFMGANLAPEVAAGVLSEATVGLSKASHKDTILRIFECDRFKISFIRRGQSIELCGALKNIICVALGIADGREWGVNTSAMIFRQGLIEMKHICKLVGEKLPVLESGCIGDLYVSSKGGRNYKYGIVLSKRKCCEEEFCKMMKDQMLQGPCAAKQVIHWFMRKDYSLSRIPVINTVYRICFEDEPVETLLANLRTNTQ